MTTDYCTTDIDAAHRFDYWSDVVRQHCLPASSRLLAQDAFDGRLSFSLAGTVGISTMVAPLLHRWSRQASHIRQRDDDDLWIGYMRAGQGALDQKGRHARLNSGDLFLYDSARPFDCALTAQCLHLCRIPRHALLQRYPDAEQMTVRIFDSSKPTLLQLRTMIEQAVCIDFDQIRPTAAAQFGTTLLDLLGLMLEFQQERQECASERGLHGRIAAYIRGHFLDPELTLQTLARAHGISVRTVTRAFARQPQGAMGLVWQLRLQASRQALMEGRARNVTEAAFDHGFADLSHFSHAFHRAFGVRPSALLRQR